MSKSKRTFRVKWKPVKTHKQSTKFWSLFKRAKEPNRIGFYVELPRAAIKEIRGRVTKAKPQWKVVVEMVRATTPKKRARK